MWRQESGSLLEHQEQQWRDSSDVLPYEQQDRDGSLPPGVDLDTVDRNAKHLETIVWERDLFVMRGSQDSLKCSSVSRDI